MRAFTIPTIFTAVDKFTGPVDRMAASMDKMEKKSKAFNNINKQILNVVSSAALFAAAFSTVSFGVKSIMDYETALHSLEAVTGETASLFKNQIETIAIASRKSAIDVAKSFEIVGSAMSQYLSDPKALGQITEAGITLSKASRMELEPSLLALTSVMNQFGLSADKANDTINRLTAGEIVGSISTAKISQYLQEFGGVAKTNNVTISESVALLEVLGKTIPVETLGRASRNLITFMSAAAGMPKEAQKSMAKHGVSIDLVMDKTQTFGARLKELSKIQNDAVAMIDVFGKENIAAGTAIFDNLPLYDSWAAKIATTNKATEQAAVNSNTLANAAVEVKNSFVNVLVSGEKLTPALELIKSLTFWVARNMDSIIGITAKVIGVFALWYGSLMLVKGALIANKLIADLYFLGGMIKYIAATQQMTFASAALAVAQSSLNALWLANPIGVVVAGMVALGVAAYGVYSIMSEQTSLEKASQSIKNRALENTINQRVESTMLFQALRKANVGSKEHLDLLKKIDALQPGIVDQYKLQAGALDSISRAEQDLASNIMKRAMADAKAELLREKIAEKLRKQIAGPTFLQQALGIMSGGGAAFFLGEQFKLQEEIDAIANTPMPLLNTEKTKQDSIVQTNNAKASLDITMKDPRLKAKTDSNWVNIYTTPTTGQRD